ncbi:MAG: Fe2+-dependent dioxygenase [Comamonas sp. SCN 65-56]|uniref:Fe2+-dependent dioxygenase n=1 Tax=Comamonas sp. SCN 65-56 TaxID=1660095 RepID=UPI00086AF92D|nr:Fe2+-dependent dioxygenase [Comamonas sp. SCN 65-56]ODS90645.1 MAG: Fe2+-dependent dioxygenase [Comamonas sp. SCN 65-56]
MLIAIDHVLTAAQVAQFRAQLDSADWHDGARTAGTLAKTVKRNQQLPDGSELAVRLGRQILQRLAATPLFVSAALPRTIYPPKFNRYADGGEYGAHVDSALMVLPDSSQQMRTDLSATLFLAEPEDYDGGVLEVDGPFGVQQVKLAAGDMVLYPSSSLHRVTPVTRGARLASFFWIESLVADETERSLLFDLDQSVQRFTPLVAPDDARLVQLSGVYHNLLRRWARP